MTAQPPHRPPSSPPPGYPARGPGRPSWVVPVVAGLVVLALVVVGGVGYELGKNSAPSAAPAATAAASASASNGAAASAAAASAAPSASASASSASPASASHSAARTVTVAPTVTSPHPSPSLVTTAPPSHPVPDFGYVRTVSTVAGVTHLVFDRATLLTGPAAVSAAKSRGQEPEDDYFIINDNPLLRTFTVSPTAVIAGSILLSGKEASQPSTITALESWVVAHPGEHLPVDLYYDAAGNVIKVAEVFFP